MWRIAPVLWVMALGAGAGPPAPPLPAASPPHPVPAPDMPHGRGSDFDELLDAIAADARHSASAAGESPAHGPNSRLGDMILPVPAIGLKIYVVTRDKNGMEHGQ